MRALTAVPTVAAAIAGLATFTGAAQTPAAQDDDLGESLYLTGCASCHGVEGEGVEDRGPSLRAEGRASVDFVLRTGRMPLASPDVLPSRGPVRYSEAEIVALVDYAGAFGEGPDIPNVDVAAGDLAAGGQLYRLNCAACHVASGSGAAIGGGRYASSLMESTPTQIGQAVLIGPGAMPVFGTFTDEEINSVAAYVVDLQEMDTTAPDDFGGAGPVAEGLAAWLLALLPIIAFTRWIGTPHEGRDELAEEEH